MPNQSADPVRGGDKNAALLSRRLIFADPDCSVVRISPDGTRIAFRAPVDGVLNIWVAPRADSTAARALTDEKVRPIRSYFWSPDSASVLFVNDQGGDENFKLFGVPATGGAVRILTPFDKTQTRRGNHEPDDDERTMTAPPRGLSLTPAGPRVAAARAPDRKSNV